MNFKVVSVSLLITALVILVGIAVWFAPTVEPEYHFGLYVGEGTWSKGNLAFQNFFEEKGYEWKLLTAEDINQASDLASKVEVLLVPGGWAWPYTQDVTASGEENIKKFVEGGGNFIGVCAGAFYPAEYIVWEGEKIDYPLNLFDGAVKGALEEIIPWDGYQNTRINLNREHPVNEGFPSSLTMVYFGGGDIWPDEEVDFEVIGYYETTGTKAMGSFSYGEGNVLLIGPHPEMGLTSDGEWDVTGGATAGWEWLAGAVDWLLE